jgi:hypothetical protein
LWCDTHDVGRQRAWPDVRRQPLTDVHLNIDILVRCRSLAPQPLHNLRALLIIDRNRGFTLAPGRLILCPASIASLLPALGSVAGRAPCGVPRGWAALIVAIALQLPLALLLF